ncbi:MAG: S8 family serine peptidase, partial [Pirellulales bacterium]|nr:S8 family serine peptidase [Pirellulales bacterium]
MMIWDAVRRFSGVGKRKGAARTINPRSRRREILGSFRGRDLRMEQFEDRVLLSITPPAGLQELESFVCPIENYSYLSDSLSVAVFQASDLSDYAEAQLETTYQWVVGVDGTANAPQLAASMGADFIAYAPYLTGATVWEFSEGASWINVAQALQSAEGVDYFYPLVSSELAAAAVPNDTLFSDQWHLQNTGQSGGIPGLDCNVVPAWDTVTGDGVVIAIVDDGLEMDHPDLIGNLRADLSYDFNNGDNDPSPEDTNPWDNHGTSVAGVAGGVGNNGLGVSGTAPGAELAGLRLISSWIDDYTIASALSYLNQDIDIYNNSWGRTSFLIGEGPLSLAAIEAGAANGRGGLGSIYVFAASNDREWGGNANYFDLQNSRQVIAVAAIDHNGRYSYYSNPGAPVLISGYSNSLYSDITTSDRTGEDGYNSTGIADGDPLPDINYTSTFGGTSSAAPLVSGIIALILDANPDLTYRDVQHILVESAEMNDPADYDWVQNGAGYWVNHNYGFGAVDATAAVELALDWENVTEEVSTGSHEVQVHEDIPDSDITGISSTVALDDSVEKIEWVEVTVDIPHSYPNDLEIILVSPDGTESRLAEPTSLSWYFGGSYEQWTFSSCHHWGESSEGQWTLKVRDLSSGISGVFNTWELNVYGTSESTGPGPGPGPDEAVDGPELVSISPNQGGTIQNETILHVAPSELTFLFNERQVIDSQTLGAIHVVRSGGDDVLGNANDVTIEYGWIGIGDRPNEVVIRFAETLPDDLYQITIIGDGSGGD